MTIKHNPFLIAGAALSAIAALLHLGCIVFGPSWYRFVGAGEEFAQMVAAGHWYPAALTSAIAAILLVWSLYALSGAGLIRRLPFTRFVLCAVTGVYLLRAVAFVPLMAYFPGNSMPFWLTSSAICLLFGVVHLIGLRQVWPKL